MRGLFKWAKAAKHVSADPTDGIDYPRRKKGAGFPVWTEEARDGVALHAGGGSQAACAGRDGKGRPRERNYNIYSLT